MDRRLGLRLGQGRARLLPRGGQAQGAHCWWAIRIWRSRSTARRSGTSTRQHAPIYSKGRVFCGGDAVHRHPPSSGLGSNTCMQDAFNLAWKLAFVVKGHAGERLLDSYTWSARRWARRSSPAPTSRAWTTRRLRECFDHATRRTRWPRAGTKLGPTPEGVARRAALAEALKLKNSEFNAQGVELNQRCMSDGRHSRSRRDRRVGTRPAALPPGHDPAGRQAAACVARRRTTAAASRPWTWSARARYAAHRPRGRRMGRRRGQLDLPFLRTVVTVGSLVPSTRTATGSKRGSSRGRRHPGPPGRLRRLAPQRRGVGRREATTCLRTPHRSPSTRRRADRHRLPRPRHQRVSGRSPQARPNTSTDT